VGTAGRKVISLKGGLVGGSAGGCASFRNAGKRIAVHTRKGEAGRTSKGGKKD